MELKDVKDRVVQYKKALKLEEDEHGNLSVVKDTDGKDVYEVTYGFIKDTPLVKEPNEIHRNENSFTIDLGNGKRQTTFVAGFRSFFKDGDDWFDIDYEKTTVDNFEKEMKLKV